MNLRIESVENGWSLTWDGDDGERRAVVGVGDESRAGAGQRLLWEIIEILNLAGSRYDAERIRVTLEPGDKHEWCVRP